MAEAFIAGAVRTPIGKRNGGLAGVHPVDLGAHALRALVDRTGVDPAAVDDVIMGCVSQIGPQTFDIARNAWLSAGLPESVPGVTVDRQCGSSQQAVQFAAQAVLSGTQDLVIAAGVESMSVVPMGSTATLPAKAGLPYPWGRGWRERYGDQEISQFRGAQMICDSNLPSSMARTARWWLSSANSSSWLRFRSHCSHIICAPRNWEIS